MIFTYLKFHLGTPFKNQVIVHTASLISNMMMMMMIYAVLKTERLSSVRTS